MEQQNSRVWKSISIEMRAAQVSNKPRRPNTYREEAIKRVAIRGLVER